MDSPPATPPESPEKGEPRRFVPTCTACECGEDYRRGGFHPVDLENTFDEGRYKVIRKLGYGSFSTVWLAVNKTSPKFVAVKIMTAKASTSETGLKILDYLSQRASLDFRAQFLTIPIHSFEISGPNGKHRCLVFEPMGATAALFVEELPENRSRSDAKEQRRYPVWMAKKILLRTLQGLAFLHENGIVHGDVQPGNILLSTKDINHFPEESLEQKSGGDPLHRVDRKVDRWAPEKLYVPESLHDHVPLDDDLYVKLSDLESAFWLNEPPKKIVTPVTLRAPELILHQSFDQSIDIWSFGCLFYEFLIGRVLFPFMISRLACNPEEDANDDHLSLLHEIIAPVPGSLPTDWPRHSKWYGQDLQPLNLGDEEKPYKPHLSLEQSFQEEKPDYIDEDESKIICTLLRSILQYDPAKRPSANELLQHPWFKE